VGSRFGFFFFFEVKDYYLFLVKVQLV